MSSYVVECNGALNWVEASSPEDAAYRAVAEDLLPIGPNLTVVVSVDDGKASKTKREFRVGLSIEPVEPDR